jgi:hypothetical protein
LLQAETQRFAGRFGTRNRNRNRYDTDWVVTSDVGYGRKRGLRDTARYSVKTKPKTENRNLLL